MSINIIQTCDGCGKERELELKLSFYPVNLQNTAERGGWMQLDDGKTLCSDCIRKALS